MQDRTSLQVQDLSGNDLGPSEAARLQQARLAALQEVVLSLTSTLELHEVLERVARMAQELVEAGHAHIFLYDARRDELTLVARHWSPERTSPPPLPRRTGVTFAVAHSGIAQFVEDASLSPAYANSPPDRRPAALASLPLLKAGRVLGTLNLGFWKPRTFDPETRDFLDLLARHAAIAIDNAQLYTSLQRQTRELEALREIGLEISGQLDLKKLTEDVVRRGCELLDVPGGYVFLYDPAGQTLELFAEQGVDREIVGRKLHLGEGLSGRVAQERRAMAVQNYHSWQERARPFSEVPIGAIIAAPLHWQNQLLGTLGFNMLAEDTRTFGEEDLRLVEQLAAQTAIAVQNARLFAEAQEHAQQLDRRLQALGLVNEISHRVNSLDLNEVQESALEQMITRFSAVFVAIGVYDLTSQTVTITAVRPSDDPLRGTVFHVENQPDLAKAIELRRTVVWKDDPTLVSDHPTRLYFRGRGTKVLVLAPLIVKDQVIGFMGLDPGTREPGRMRSI